MSKYKVIATEYTDKAALIAALLAAGIPYEAHGAPATLYGYQGDPRQEKAHVIVRRAHIGSASNDLGWVWDEAAGAYRAIVSQYDLSCAPTTRIRNQVRQEYAVNKVVKEARKRGLRVERETDATGQIRLRLKGQIRGRARARVGTGR